MDRKSFLQVCGGVAATGLLPRMAFGAQPKADTATKTVASYAWQFYGTGDGKIYRRETQNDPWVLHTDLGPGYGVFAIYQSGRVVRADIGHNTQKFTLQLTANGQHWSSVTSH